jgi:hypothetical protein
MINLEIKLMLCLYMVKSSKMIKPSLNILVIFSGIKKKHIYGKNELFICLVVKTICLSDI